MHSALRVSIWDHLRVCGADRQPDQRGYRVEGSPPRVRSRRTGTFDAPALARITSACAEQTVPLKPKAVPLRDHLRVCGADKADYRTFLDIEGSPPRVRSRLPEVHADLQPLGITSACAEQTWMFSGSRRWPRDHLRVCGADHCSNSITELALGSPPRVRSRLVWRGRQQREQGITSACAEQTSRSRAKRIPPRDHLRVCGADSRLSFSKSHPVGSPPRVRSRPYTCHRARCGRRITSACAEQTLRNGR